MERIVNPLGIVAKRNVLYLIAESSGDMRIYRISRLSLAAILFKVRFYEKIRENITL
ncbi:MULTISPECIES: WYL domain-containing protein [unclassified Paenibacillus]|uniref:WYL domain-containing protein n=1 Tax=unclassified Paenibacillus TaxID=185978 RepID=UPI0009FA5EFD|nr:MULTISPECIES: WYL domain-containing protein [unclassified Paenibacillus]